MSDESTPTWEPGAGQTLLTSPGPAVLDSQRAKELYRLSDPALSELALDELLDEILTRVRTALSVDTVAILLLDEESQQLVARAARGIEEEVERGVRIPLGRGFAGRIAAERVPILIADVDHADVLNPILREKGISSLLGVPLIVEGVLLGVMHVGSLHPRPFGADDLAILQLAAARVAPAIERARLFAALEHEHQVAAMLQRSLLPKRLPEVVGVSVAGRYLPARDEVGGDWYDVIELPRGLLGIAIGDVVGHGIRAAALMGQLRTALHCYAMEGHPPGHTLELVDRFAHGMSEPAMATAAYAQFDPDTGVLRCATAGHLPPIILSSAGARSLELAPCTPLGAFAYSRCPEHELRLNAGETLVLYTDGLVERRDTLLSDSIEDLMDTIGEGVTPEDMCLLAIDRLMRLGPGRDDAAIVAMQNTAIPDELRLRLPAEPRMLTETRQALRRWLREQGVTGDAVREITIAAGEACANAIEHAYSPAAAFFELEATTDGEWVMVTVRDTGRWREPRGRDRGRGLTIIRAAMDDVDVASTAEGTVISMRRRLSAR